MWFIKQSIFLSTVIAVGALFGLSSCNRNNPKATEVEKKSPQGPQDKAAVSTTAQIIGSLDSQHYYIASSATWVIGDDTFLSAVIETKRKPSDPISPVSRLTIKNLSSNTILYREDIDGAPFYMYIRNVTPDTSPELIVDLRIAAVSNQFQIFSVTPSQAHLILDENYRFDATLINLGKEGVDVLVTTGERGMGPFTTTLYTFRNDKYEPVGEASYKKLATQVRKLVTQPNNK